jgi:hypothetical protein
MKNHLKIGRLSEEKGYNDLYTIHYDTRPETTRFLSNISETNPDSDTIMNNIDAYYIRLAYQTVEKWFEDAPAESQTHEKRLSNP